MFLMFREEFRKIVSTFFRVGWVCVGLSVGGKGWAQVWVWVVSRRRHVFSASASKSLRSLTGAPHSSEATATIKPKAAKKNRPKAAAA